jgi:hypothetical protein
MSARRIPDMEEKNQSVTGENPGDILQKIAFAARTGDEAGTARLLNRFLQILQKSVLPGIKNSEGLSKITFSLETLLGMQQMKDWVAFADILEYELHPLLEKYGPVP